LEKASKNLIANLKKQKRENKSLLFLDNVKIVKDALAEGTIQPECFLTSLTDEEFENLGILYKNKIEILQVSQSIIEQLSDTKSPQKVLCIAYLYQYVVEEPKTNFLVLDGLQDPGNVGTLIRTAKACGFEYVFLLDSVRKTNPKLIRSSVGAVFNNKVYEMSHEDFCEFAKKNKLKLISTDMNGENIFDFADKLHCHTEPTTTTNKNKKQEIISTKKPSQTVGVVIGNEGQGVSEEISTLCFKTVRIPMKEGIESLNAGVSGSIIMYEINKNGLL